MEELFARGAEGFIDALRKIHSNPQRLGALADRWAADHRPWARERILEYFAMPLSCPMHQPVVKRLFKRAEADGNHAVLAACLVAFDRLVRRKRKSKWRYDWKTRSSWMEEYLKSPRDTMPGARRAKDPRTGQMVGIPPVVRANALLFSYHTRYHLRRRAWRYFRRLGFRKPGEYVSAIAAAMKLYTDADLHQGENLLDSWGLIHACFGRSDVLLFSASSVSVAEGRSLGEMAPAPMFPKLWQETSAATTLLSLAAEASSYLVRMWAIALLRQWHRQTLVGIPPEQLLKLLDSPDESVQQFGAELLESAGGLAKLPIAGWLRLIQTRNLTALETICRVMSQHVTAERLELAQCIDLACARPTPVARMGLAFLMARLVRTAEDREAIAAVSAARSAAVGRELAAWALGILGTKESYDLELVSRFYDSLLAEVRLGAWDWLKEGSPGYGDAALWSRLFESPHEDVKLRLVEELEKRTVPTALAKTDGAPLVRLWTAVLLGIHRGGRKKLSALRQISDEIRRNPRKAQTLLPVLAVAIRSVRLPEARAGLAAAVAAMADRPELAAAVRQSLPELQVSAEEAVI